MEAMIQEWIGKCICPHCHESNLTVEQGYISCKVCKTNGNPEMMRWCLKVPVFNPVDPSNFRGQLYQADFGYWQMMGYATGCGREVKGGFCTVCRTFLPGAVDHAERKSRARPARVEA